MKTKMMKTLKQTLKKLLMRQALLKKRRKVKTMNSSMC